ncbi:MAG: tRNA 2-thiouridine(34) synthase MnmA [Bacteroides sp.]|uniref:tRNA 2-thiouridine(34) synthase MnmA n=1 Tax=Bacteroides sp. TaxID=29523 RepID=UPI002FC67C3F
MKEDKRVLLGMSGGTDSSVAAMLLQAAGYEVTGVTFRFYELNGSTEYLDDARALADRLGIAHVTYDAREVFKERIVNYFVDEYMAGRTPVPCTLCNNYLKWPLLAKIADEMGIFHLSTGHYVRKVLLDGKYYITPAVDRDKDQSFFLWGLQQEVLERMLLPMGEMTKPAARAYAAERGFAKVSTKKDSLGVCFCPMDYRSFLKEYVTNFVTLPDASKTVCDASLTSADNSLVTPGNVTECVTKHFNSPIGRGRFLDEKGHFIAWHEGYPLYTIGQRRGLGIDLNRAVFVKEIRPATNEVVLAPLQSLERMEMVLKEWHLTDEARVLGHDDIVVKIRYRKQHNHCTVTVTAEGLLHVQLHEPLTAIAPGQAAAFYKDGLLLGGGIIEF